MNQTDTMIDVLSESRAGSKLKNITIQHSPHLVNHSLITFIFEGSDNGERSIGIFGEDLSVSSGSKSKLD